MTHGGQWSVAQNCRLLSIHVTSRANSMINSINTSNINNRNINSNRLLLILPKRMRCFSKCSNSIRSLNYKHKLTHSKVDWHLSTRLQIYRSFHLKQLAFRQRQWHSTNRWGSIRSTRISSLVHPPRRFTRHRSRIYHRITWFPHLATMRRLYLAHLIWDLEDDHLRKGQVIMLQGLERLVMELVYRRISKVDPWDIGGVYRVKTLVGAGDWVRLVLRMSLVSLSCELYKRLTLHRSDFLQSITANDGSLLPPSRGRSHSRHSSASSARSASPALSISSQGSSMSHNSPRMVMPDEQEVVGGKVRSRMPRMKVTSMATEMASSARRTNDGVFVCPSESAVYRRGVCC